MTTSVMFSTASERRRLAILWLCIGLFLLRVVGQLEALLVAPTWLPPMDDWYSGLLPYPLLLPAQILLLMIMVALVVAQTYGSVSASASGRWQRWVRILALIYFVAMGVRLIVQFARGAQDMIAAHGIPIAFHWILALFLLVLARAADNEVSDDKPQSSLGPPAFRDSPHCKNLDLVTGRFEPSSGSQNRDGFLLNALGLCPN